MALPWLLGAAAVAIVGAIASSSDDKEKEENARRRAREIEDRAEEARKEARRKEKERERKARQDALKKEAKAKVDNLMYQFDLSLSSNQQSTLVKYVLNKELDQAKDFISELFTEQYDHSKLQAVKNRKEKLAELKYFVERG